MKVHKIANYEQMMEAWKNDLRSAAIEIIISTIMITFLISTVYFTPYISKDYHYWEVLGFLFIFTMPLSIPPILMGVGKKPKPRDVLDNIAMRQACGMDDSVSGK